MPPHHGKLIPVHVASNLYILTKSLLNCDFQDFGLQQKMKKSFTFGAKRVLFTFVIALVMLHSVVAYHSLFKFASRARHGKAVSSASIMADVISKQSVEGGNEGSKAINKNMKLGVLFLNLGGPETIKVLITNQILLALS